MIFCCAGFSFFILLLEKIMGFYEKSIKFFDISKAKRQ